MKFFSVVCKVSGSPGRGTRSRVAWTKVRQGTATACKGRKSMPRSSTHPPPASGPCLLKTRRVAVLRMIDSTAEAKCDQPCRIRIRSFNRTSRNHGSQGRICLSHPRVELGSRIRRSNLVVESAGLICGVETVVETAARSIRSWSVRIQLIPAAKRRKNAAHGVSRGEVPKNCQPRRAEETFPKNKPYAP